MTKYIWFNPVVKSLNSYQSLQEFVSKFSFNEVDVNADLITHVKEKYYETIKNSQKTVIDMRCPMAADLIKDEYNDDYIFPRIHPILIHCAIELADTYVKNEDDFLIITTPCQSLADYGNNLRIKNTKFITWLNLLKEYNYTIVEDKLNESPIPPGFFDCSEVDVLNLKSKNEIDNYFMKTDAHKHELVEMLYCENGCHNGDGIIENK